MPFCLAGREFQDCRRLRYSSVRARLLLTVIKIIMYGLRQVSFGENVKNYFGAVPEYIFESKGSKRRYIDYFCKIPPEKRVEIVAERIVSEYYFAEPNRAIVPAGMKNRVVFLRPHVLDEQDLGQIATVGPLLH